MTIASQREHLLAIAAEIRDFLSTHADETLAARNAYYFKEGYNAHGLPRAILEAQVKYWRKKYCPVLGLDGCLDLGDLLFADGGYEEGMIAIRLLHPFRLVIDSAAYQRLGQWIEFGVHNWAHDDVLCGEILSVCLRNGLVALEEMDSWRTSPFKYKRRAVPVAMLGFLKTDRDRHELLEFVRPLILDQERVVQQGLGWFLRETWKVAPGPVEEFLLEWKDQAPRLIYQYATEKMTAEGKARFRRAKPNK